MRRVVTYILAALVTLPAMAQLGDYRSELAFGVHGGLNMASVTFKPRIKQNQLNGPQAGIAIRYTCEKLFTCIGAIQMEVNYSQMGWKEFIDDGSENQYSAKMNYVQVPLLARLGWGRERNGLQGFLTLGPQVGFFLNKTEVYGGATWDTSNRPNGVTYQYGKDPDKTFDYGLLMGAGVEHSSKMGHFLLEARYYFGLADIYDNSKRGYFGRSGMSSITVRLGYMFDLFKSNNPNIK